jgi:hypothetical protein
MCTPIAHNVSELTKLSQGWSSRRYRKRVFIRFTGLISSQFVEFLRMKEDNNSHYYYIRHAKLYELSENVV